MRRAIILLVIGLIACPGLLAISYPQLPLGGGYKSSISRGHAFGVERSGSVNTAFAWCSFYQSDPFDITLTLYDSTGAQVQQKVIPYTGHLPRFFTEVFDNVPGEFVGQVRMTSTPGLGLAVLRFEQAGDAFQLTSTPSKTFELAP